MRGVRTVRPPPRPPSGGARAYATARRKPKVDKGTAVSVSKPRARPSRTRMPKPTKASERRQLALDQEAGAVERAELDKIGVERFDEDKEEMLWREGLKEFSPSFKGLKFNKKRVPIASDSEADSWMRHFMKMDVPDNVIPDDAFKERDSYASKPAGAASLTLRDVDNLMPTKLPDSLKEVENHPHESDASLRLGDMTPAGKLYRMSAEIVNVEGTAYWNGIEIPGEYVQYFEDPDNPKSLPQRIQRYLKKMKRIEEWRKQHPRERKISSWRTDARDAPLTRRQMMVSEKLTEILERVLTEYTGTQWPLAVRKMEFRLVETVVSKDMRILHIIWDCKPERKQEIRELIERDLKRLRKEVTAKAKMKWSPELRFVHYDDSELADIDAEEQRASKLFAEIEEEYNQLSPEEQEQVDNRKPDRRRRVRDIEEAIE